MSYGICHICGRKWGICADAELTQMTEMYEKEHALVMVCDARIDELRADRDNLQAQLNKISQNYCACPNTCFVCRVIHSS